jgi:hypothetical protein
MITKCNEQIKEQLATTRMHLHLHGATSLESGAASDDESEIVCSEFGVVVWWRRRSELMRGLWSIVFRTLMEVLVVFDGDDK